jgi:solute:Na+ symporter, SSS family
MLPHWMLFLSVLSFFVLLVYIGRLTSRWIASSADFFVSGREVSLLINACAIGGIGLAASFVSAIPQFAVTLGFFPACLFGLMWAVSVILFGSLVGGFIRRSGTYTISEWLGMRLGARTRVVCAACQVLGTVSVMAANIAGIAAILEPMTGYPYIVNVVAITTGFLLYTFLGGMWAVTIVDVAQIAIGLPAYYWVSARLLHQTDFLAGLPEAGWRLHDIAGRLPLFDLTFPSALTFVLTWLLFVFGSQYYWIRLASARSERGAIGGAVWGGTLGITLLVAPMALIGLFAVTLVPGPWAPNQAWGQLVGHVLPAPLAVWMLIAVLGASMSTASTALMGASSTVLRDFYQRFARPEATSRELVLPGRIAVLGAGALTCLLAVFYPGGAAWLLAAAGAWFGTPAVVLLLSIYWRRITPAGGFWGILAGLTATLAWQLGPYWKSVAHMVCIATAVTLSVSVLVSWLTQVELRRAKRSFERSAIHGQILDLLRRGRTTLDALIDGLEMDGERVYCLLHELVDAGLIGKAGETGRAQLTFRLTAAGAAVLPPLESEEAALIDAHGITPADYGILKALGENPRLKAGDAALQGLDRHGLGQAVSHLIRCGYLETRGLFRRRVKPSHRGRRLLADRGSGPTNP